MPVAMPPMPPMPAKAATEKPVRCNFASTAIFGKRQFSYFWRTEKAQQAGGPNIAAHRETKQIILIHTSKTSRGMVALKIVHWTVSGMNLNTS